MKPLRIVTSEAGGGNDVPARIVAQGLTLALGQQVVIENRPSGVVPAEIVAKAAPNGYTLLFYNNALWTAPLIQATPYDMLRDFTPVSAVARAVNVLVVNSALPAKSVAELIALAKTKPGGLNYGSSGTGASNHLAAEMFRTMAQIDIVRVNYRSNPAVVTDLIAGHIPMAIPDFNTGLPQLKMQKVRALAVLTKERNRVLPEVPTLNETVMPGFDILAWAGMFGPANLPPEIVKVLADAVQKALSTPLVIERLNAGGTEVFWSGPQEFSEFVKTELVKWTAAIKEAGIEPE